MGDNPDGMSRRLRHELLAMGFIVVAVALAVFIVGLSPAPAAQPTLAITAQTTPSPEPSPTLEPTPEPTPPVEPTPGPGEFRIAFFADNYHALIDEAEADSPADYDDPDLELPARTLKLIYAEGADLALVGGDLGYDVDPYPSIPERWDRMITIILGQDYPLFVTRGNHDVRDWESADPDPTLGFAGLGYRDVMKRRWEAVEASPIADDIACTFATDPSDIGTKSTCVYKDVITFISSGLGSGNGVPPTKFGEPDNEFEAYLKSELDKSTTAWTVCNWHFNQTIFQTGYKRNEAGWKPYEYCREAGALISTGHEHAYSRTSVLKNFSSTIRPSDIVDVGHELTIDAGRTLAWVSGLGGRPIRSVSSMADLPWWEAKVNATNQSEEDGAGVLFCDFKTDGNANASCFFKTVDGKVHDRFEIVSQANGATGEFTQILDPVNVLPTAPDVTIAAAIGRSIAPTAISAYDPDGPSAVKFFSDDLPDGISLNESTGMLSGTPRRSGLLTSTVSVWDGAGATDVTVTFDVEPQLLEAKAESSCVDDAGWIDVTVTNSSALASRDATVAVGNLDIRRVSVPPNSEVLVRRTGRPDGLHQVVVRDEAGESVLDTQVEVNCAAPLKVSCLAGNGRIDAHLYNRGTAGATYEVRVGELAPRSRVVYPFRSTRVTVTGRPDGPIPILITRDGVTEQSETVVIRCDPRPESGVEVTNSCLATNGRIDVHLWNDGASTATYTVTVGSLDPRTRVVEADRTQRVTVTGRPDGDLPIRVERDGLTLFDESRVVSCDS